jgi:hypothetical protein
MTIKFIHLDDKGTLGFPGTRDEIVMTTHEVTLTDVIGVFERFLKAVGYSFDGHLDFVDDFGEPVDVVPPIQYNPEDVAFNRKEMNV